LGQAYADWDKLPSDDDWDKLMLAGTSLC